MHSNTAGIAQHRGQPSDAASSGHWPAILEELDLQRAIDLGRSRDLVYLRRALETERSMRRFGSSTASPVSVFEVVPAAEPVTSRVESTGASLTHRQRGHETGESSRAERIMLGQAAGQAQLAVVMLNAQGEVVQMTPDARTALAAGDGIALRGKRLVATASAEQTLFRGLLADATHAGLGSEMERPDEFGMPNGEGAMLLTRRAPRRPLQIVVTPLRAADLPVEMQGAVLVYVCDPGAVPLSRAPILRRLYGLSPTEGRLVDELAAGVELQEAAHHLRLTVHTARFHLKSIFRKTAVNRQSDLIRLVMSFPGASV